MTSDRRALTIVIAFLGLVMFGFFIANACAVATHDRSGDQRSAPIETVQNRWGSFQQTARPPGTAICFSKTARQAALVV